jgi:hypothetical protein
MIVWAAVFAKEFNISNPPSRCIIGPDAEAEWEVWESTQTQSAIENATGAVERLRASLPDTKHGWGEDHNVCKCLTAILSDEK